MPSTSRFIHGVLTTIYKETGIIWCDIQPLWLDITRMRSSGSFVLIKGETDRDHHIHATANEFPAIR